MGNLEQRIIGARVRVKTRPAASGPMRAAHYERHDRLLRQLEAESLLYLPPLIAGWGDANPEADSTAPRWWGNPLALPYYPPIDTRRMLRIAWPDTDLACSLEEEPS